MHEKTNESLPSAFQKIAAEETRKALEMTPEMFMNMIRPAESEEARKTFEHNNEALGNIPQDLRERSRGVPEGPKDHRALRGREGAPGGRGFDDADLRRA